MTADEQRAEVVNGAVHAVAGLIAGMCLGHNVRECVKRPNWHNGIYAVVYFGAVWFEFRNTFGHWSAGHEGKG